MSETTQPFRVLCISSAIKGQALIHELKRQGCTVILLTEERWRNDPEWPYESVDHMVYMPSLYRKQEVINQVGYMLRGWQIDLIIPLDDYEVEMAASLREHLRMRGMGETAGSLLPRQARHARAGTGSRYSRPRIYKRLQLRHVTRLYGPRACTLAAKTTQRGRFDGHQKMRERRAGVALAG